MSRPFVAGLTAGARSFSSDLDLETDAAFGLRLGLGANERVTVLLDVLHTAPARETTGASAQVTALRGLAQVRLLLGTVRPYLLLGGGGILFNFDDTSDAGAGAVTAGGGFEFPVGKQVRLSVEGSADIYRARTVSYSSTGEELSATDRDTQTAVAALAGLSLEF